MPRLILERPVTGSTPAGQLALHEAGYREVVARLPASGLVLDVGCGDGDESVRLTGGSRTVVGLDYDLATASRAAARFEELRVVCGDGARLPYRAGSFAAVCSSHLVEHFTDPEHHVAELARVVADDGTVFVVTPNAPTDFENPYHVSLFEADPLAALLRRHFGDVEVLGLDGDEVVKADFARRRTLGARLLKLDVFELRRRLPEPWFIRIHGLGRRLIYPFLVRGERRRPPVTAERFSLSATVDDTTLVLFAVARRPRR